MTSVEYGSPFVIANPLDYLRELGNGPDADIFRYLHRVIHLSSFQGGLAGSDNPTQLESLSESEGAPAPPAAHPTVWAETGCEVPEMSVLYRV